MRWILPTPPNQPRVTDLAAQLGVPPFVAAIMLQRGFDESSAPNFLSPSLRNLSDPFLLPDMDRAIDRTLHAIDQHETICLYGDYDVDGVTSVALLKTLLDAYGAAAHTFLPSRIDEGYGLTPDGVARCLKLHAPQLLIAVDCGTSSVAEIAKLRSKGIAAIVLDHHEVPSPAPDCDALVNPKRSTTFHYLCSAGLAFKFAHALLKRRPLENFDLREHLDLVAVGSVADLVPLVDENRILVSAGLRRLQKTSRPGLQELIALAAPNKQLGASDIGFRIGPRLNAAGRLGTAEEALELLLTSDARRARSIAASLDQQNRERQEVERHTLDEAQAQLESAFQPDRDAAIVVGARGWHTGVIGIVASRLMRTHHRPTLVVGFNEDGLGKGSGRSVEGLSLVDALSRASAFLEGFGGHDMAAGLTVREDRFADFADRFRAVARETLTDEDLVPTLRLDAPLSLSDVDDSFLDRHAALQPFGIGNPQPLFYASGVATEAEPRILKERHLLVELRQGRRRVRAIFFGGAERPLPRPPWDVAFKVEPNEYQGTISAQIQIQQIRHSGS